MRKITQIVIQSLLACEKFDNKIQANGTLRIYGFVATKHRKFSGASRILFKFYRRKKTLLLLFWLQKSRPTSFTPKN